MVVEGKGEKAWKEELQADVKKNGKPDLIVCFVTPYEEKYYAELKSWILNELNVPTQFIRRRTLNNPKGAMSAASKIDIQMSTKVGGTPWEVTKSHPYLNKPIMYGALSLSKGKKGYTLAFVGTCSADCTKVYSECKIGLKRKEEIPPETLNNIFYNWARTYFKTTKTVPGIIMMYREGLSEAQTKQQLGR